MASRYNIILTLWSLSQCHNPVFLSKLARVDADDVKTALHYGMASFNDFKPEKHNT